MLSINKAICVEDTFCYKTTKNVCNRFNTSFCTRDRKQTSYIKILKEINPTNQINDFFLTDLCFKKIFELEKKRLYKTSICKSTYVDTYYVLFVIIVIE